MTREPWIVVDLGFGDAGKGATVDFLVRDRGPTLVVRFNGGAQAGHNVVTPDGRHHTFAQFGSGTFVSGVRTLLGPDFVVHPGAMLVEEAALRQKGVADAFERTAADRRALVISPFQQAAGRLRELARGPWAHGTCGVGVGEAVRDALVGEGDSIRVGDLHRCRRRLESQQRRIRRQLADSRHVRDVRAADEWALLDDPRAVDRTLSLWQLLIPRLSVIDSVATRDTIRDAGTVVFEGAQGVLLDQDHGFHPHTTWSDCTFRGALDLVDGAGGRVHRLGVIRSHMARHGPGPFPTFDPDATRLHRDRHNDDGGWQGPVCRGALDLVLLRYAVAACGGVDGLAVNHLDELGPVATMCNAYHLDGKVVRDLPLPRSGDLGALERLGTSLGTVVPALRSLPSESLVGEIERRLATPVWLVGQGPSATDRRWVAHP
jgi:adenylosuccinate synthase